jgi:hypothetical protein
VEIIEAFLVRVIAEALAQSLDTLLADLPRIKTAWVQANTTVMTDAPAPPPGLVDQLNKEISDANGTH